MVLKITISEYLLVLSSTVKQILYTKVDIQPVLKATVIALNVHTDVVCLLNKIELLVMSDVAYVSHRCKLF